MPGSLEIVPNDGYPSHGGDLDSVGLYQQRARWWGSTAGSMDPFTASTRFLERMLGNAPDWLTDNESNTCQRVQQSQYNGVSIDPKTGKPYPFGGNYQARSGQVDALDTDPQYFTHLSA